MTTHTIPKDKRFAVRLNMLIMRGTQHWLRIVLILVSIYVALPFVAPVLMKAGVTGPAKIIYTAYSPFCHQFAFRSFFLFGEQTAYPRGNTGTDLRSFEEYARDLPEFADLNYADPNSFDRELIFSARGFIGNEQLGYKLTLCERDISIYTAILVGGLLYVRVRRRLRPAPIWLYVILGLGPIGLDGFSQLLGYPPFNFWPPRETLPIFRVVTGALFGLMNVWLAFPYLEEYMQDTHHSIKNKLRRAGIDF
ncbi:MAG: DUF2085 domain-containing protein [Chloroflexi bacterium]|nr:MAG: hypothetical protein CUN54_07045 [Phototrophicales bacterium]RMF78954.1 MAG: DUF2085 domain-containing protein [Chloroflexota bacterium]